MIKTEVQKCIYVVLGLILFSASVEAQELNDIEVQPPSGLDEGTQVVLSDEQVLDLLPWARDSKLLLEEVRDSVASARPSEKYARLLSGIRGVVLGDSTPKRTELLMRYVLNRAIKIVEMIDQHASDDVPGTLFHKNRVLLMSIEMALRYYDSDVSFLNSRHGSGNADDGENVPDGVSLPYAQFGIEYADFLLYINESILNARAQEAIASFALGVFQWDLNRDEKRLVLAPSIIKIHNFLRSIHGVELQFDREIVNRLREVLDKARWSLNYAAQALELDNPYPHRPAESEAKSSKQSAIVENEDLTDGGNTKIQLLSNPYPSGRKQGVLILGEDLSEEATGALIYALNDSDDEVSALALEKLKDREWVDEMAILFLTDPFMTNTEWKDRLEFVKLVSEKCKGPMGTKYLKVKLNDADYDVREEVVKQLQARTATQEVLDALVALLKKEDRDNVINVLGPAIQKLQRELR